jgi:hypothetical protein
MTRLCRCGLPLAPPNSLHWVASRDPDPGSAVAAVALHGRDPEILRSERVRGGWRSQGASPERTCSHAASCSSAAASWAFLIRPRSDLAISSEPPDPLIPRSPQPTPRVPGELGPDGAAEFVDAPPCAS